ncbi:hypothetical protein CN988_07530 [Bacillus thuringiensis]|uniref:hypothetical protein n=1 Tax=Bacillus thuringiensis TaxID=1428 RepID=UPI000BF732CD|nr:hypothetical protein [Bacillus thuringiensis]PFC04485.1 hypothetical protein CN302_05260 [Bacillus thuringiensis]PFC35202.1 hypothetical protein CN282_24870 [Bacillus thuringiensis]PFD64945.1 hypothetical protein CN309_14815 [Bacillus thuringiensis]PFO40715.1 hypothetical protein COJ84_17335 [Bacillus thuringiensis]PGO87102.1 hypothetical protein CN988_07530 [Bacillus thuringiensis]
MNALFSTLCLLTILAALVLLVTSFVFLIRKKQNAKKFFKFAGIASILAIIFLIIAVSTYKPQEKKEATSTENVKTTANNKDNETTQQEQPKQVEINEDAFVSYAQNIKGNAFIKDMKLNAKEAEITFHDSFSAFKSAKPDSNVTEEQYKQYFSTGDAIEKMLVSEPARLLRQFPDLNAVKMTVPFEGKTYSINLDRKSLNTYLGFKIEDLKVEDKSWVKKFNDPYVYDKTKRKAFFKKFIVVQ